MNKIISVLFGCILISQTTPASATFSLFPLIQAPFFSNKKPPDEPKPKLAENRGNLNKSEARAAAFFPASSHFRRIYGDVGLSLQVEQARAWREHRNLEIWGNFEWIYMHGHVHKCGSSHINIYNISLGLKGIGKMIGDVVYLYAGIGADLGITSIENRLRCCAHNTNCTNKTHTEHKSNIGFGGIAKSGMQIYLSSHVFLDLFADYLYLPIHYHKTRDVGGLKVGGALGARF